MASPPPIPPNPLTHVTFPDEDTAATALHIQLQDLHDLFEDSKGKRRADQLSDSDIAREIYHEELRERMIFIADRQIAKSIGSAVQNDGDFLASYRAQERQAEQDHELARRLGGLEGSNATFDSGIASKPEPEEPDDDLMARLLGYNNSYQDVDPGSQAGPSTVAARRNDVSVRMVLCEACTEAKFIFDVVKLPCKHDYCGECLRDLFTGCLTDETLFPPRCCRQPIALDSVQAFMTHGLVAAFKKREVEMSTINRIYCTSSTCSSFIPPNRIADDKATCPECNSVTCTICKSAAHLGDCPQDTALQELQTTAEASGWKRCFSCRRFVELELGCNHITCLCTAEFCYSCGAKWKTCDCQLWNEDRLYVRAARIVNWEVNQPAAAGQPQPIQNQPPAARVEEVVENLRHDRNCRHASWRYVRGDNVCDMCHDYLPNFIFACSRCGILACGRCKRNRL